MNAPRPDRERLAGWVYYDAECGLCAAGVARWGGLWARRGFRWLPLQTPGAAGRLGLTETALREEMRLLLPDGQLRSGAQAWAFLLRSVWWLWPLGVLLTAPGLNRLSRLGYRWIANHRHCWSGACSTGATVRRRYRSVAFFDLP